MTTLWGARLANSGGNDDLVSAGAPASEVKASGTTSVGSITFSAPTGGSGSSTPSVSLLHVAGSGATLSGSGLGSYTVSNLEDEDFVRVRCTHTDDGDGQVVVDDKYIYVEPATGAAWSTVWEIDFTTDITSGSTTSSGDQTIYKGDGTTPKATVNCPSGSHTTSWDSNGVQIAASGATRYAGIEMDMSGVDLDRGVFALDVITDTPTIPNGDVTVVGLGTAADGVAGTNFGMRQDFNGTNYTQATRRYPAATNGSNENSSGVQPGDIALQVVMYGGNRATVVWAEQSTYLGNEVDRDGATYFGGDPGSGGWSPATTLASIFSDPAYCFFGGTSGTTTRIKKLRLRQKT